MEKKEDLGRKKIVVQALIDKIETEDKSREIKTQVVEGYKKPEKITIKDTDHKGYTPDLISEASNRTDLYEVELDEHNYVPEKWRLFSLYSKKTKGNFSIVTPKDNLEQIKNMLRSNQINAKLIYFT